MDIITRNDKEFAKLINKLNATTSEETYSNLYHGTMRADFMNYLLDLPKGTSIRSKASRTITSKPIYFSIEEQQSELHMFNSCSRYTEDKYPMVFNMVPRRKFNLVHIDIIEGKYHSLRKEINLYHAIGDEVLINSPFERSLLGYMNLLYGDTCMDTTYDCNVLFLRLLMFMNTHFGTTYDGYVCWNDQREVALIVDDAYHMFNIWGTHVKFMDMPTTLAAIRVIAATMAPSDDMDIVDDTYNEEDIGNPDEYETNSLSEALDTMCSHDLVSYMTTQLVDYIENIDEGPPEPSGKIIILMQYAYSGLRFYWSAYIPLTSIIYMDEYVVKHYLMTMAK